MTTTSIISDLTLAANRSRTPSLSEQSRLGGGLADVTIEPKKDDACVPTDNLARDWARVEDIPEPVNDRAQRGLPIVELPGGKVPINEAAETLFKLLAQSGIYFARGGRVMKLREHKDGSLSLCILDAEEARSDFEKYARLMAWRSDDGKPVLKPTVCSVDIAKALLASEKAQRTLPPVDGLINCAVLHEDNGILQTCGRGYHAATRMVITGGDMPPEVDQHTAVTALQALIEDLDFQSEGDKSRAIASFIAPALKTGGFIKGRIPADVAEADQPQSGKTYRQRVVAAIYNEKVALVTNREGGVGSVDESLSQQLVAGRPFIQFDNFRGLLNSQHLEAFLTAEGSFPCRIPYKGELTVKPESFFIFLTSNGVETTVDFAKRSCITRIRKKPAGFSFRKYKEGDLLAHVHANQAFYLGCVFAVIRAWHAAGKPTTNETRHDFREWVQMLDWIVQNIFKLAPLMDGHQEVQERVSNPDLGFLRAVALAVEKENFLAGALTASDIQQFCETAQIAVPGARPDADRDSITRIIGGCLGRVFRNTESVEVDGYRVERRQEPVQRQDGNGSYPRKLYVFTKIGAEAVTKVQQSQTLPDTCPEPCIPPIGDRFSVDHAPGRTIVSFAPKPAS